MISEGDLKRFIALWASVEIAKARAVHCYWPNQTREVIYNADKIVSWLNGTNPDMIKFIHDSDDQPDDEAYEESKGT